MRFATSFWRCAGLACMSLALFAAEGHCQSWVDWRTKDNFKELNVEEMEKECKLTALNQPAGIYFPGEECEITLIAPEKPAEALDGGTLELIGVHNRNAAKGEVGFVLVTSGPRITRVERQPIRVAIDASKAANGELKVKLPLPDEFGTNVILLERKGGKRSFIGSVARVLKSVESKGEVPHIMAESGVSNFTGLSVIGGAEPFAAAYERMGVKLVRWEFHWQQPRQGDPYEWKMLDNGLSAVANHHIKLLNTMVRRPAGACRWGAGLRPRRCTPRTTSPAANTTMTTANGSVPWWAVIGKAAKKGCGPSSITMSLGNRSAAPAGRAIPAAIGNCWRFFRARRTPWPPA